MLWCSDERPSDVLERRFVDINITGMTFKEPVYVDMLTGYVHDLKLIVRRINGVSYDFNDLPVWDSPIKKKKKSEVNFK